jgi:DNA-binding transcriptional MerR regulator
VFVGGDNLGYKVKWVEDNLGVSRKALRNFEAKGLMPKNDGSYRDYSDEDIDRIWRIRVLQGMGYTLTEIEKMANDENFDFDSSIQVKVKELEEKKEKVDRHLGYAKTIKSTGRFPSRPKVMGSVKFDEFYEKSLNEWNISNSDEDKFFQDVADKYLNLSPEDFNKSDLGRIFSLLEKLQNHPDIFIESYLFPREIAKRKALGVDHPEVQLLVKMMYESKKSRIPVYEEMSLNQFVRFESSSYKCGDVSRMNMQNFGKEGCDFIADAIAFFGGYKNYDDVED